MFLENNDFMISIRIEGSTDTNIKCNLQIYNPNFRRKIFDLTKYWSYLGQSRINLYKHHIIIESYIGGKLENCAKCTYEIIIELLEVFQYEREKIGEQNEKYLQYLINVSEGKQR